MTHRLRPCPGQHCTSSAQGSALSRQPHAHSASRVHAASAPLAFQEAARSSSSVQPVVLTPADLLAAAAQPVMAPPDAAPIVVLPGFGNNTSDYVAPFGNPEESLVSQLQAGAARCLLKARGTSGC